MSSGTHLKVKLSIYIVDALMRQRTAKRDEATKKIPVPRRGRAGGAPKRVGLLC